MGSCWWFLPHKLGTFTRRRKDKRSLGGWRRANPPRFIAQWKDIGRVWVKPPAIERVYPIFFMLYLFSHLSSLLLRYWQFSYLFQLCHPWRSFGNVASRMWVNQRRIRLKLPRILLRLILLLPLPKAGSSAQTSKKRGLIDEDDDDVSPFLSPEGASGGFERTFVPN